MHSYKEKKNTKECVFVSVSVSFINYMDMIMAVLIKSLDSRPYHGCYKRILVH